MMSYSPQRSFLTKMMVLFVGIVMFSACEKKEPVLNHPLSADIFYSTDGLQAAFTALTHSAVSWSWDFGDGTTSTEKDPVHVYGESGYYLVTLTATDASGKSVSDQVTLALDLSPFDLLVGDYTKEDYDGKTWRMSRAHSSNDILANYDAELSLFDKSIQSLPAGAFELYLGLPEAYDGEYTFYQDGTFKHSVVNETVLGGILYASILAQMGLTSIKKTGGKAALGQDAFALTDYQPEEQAEFKFVENEDFVMPSAFGTETIPPGIPAALYPGVMTLDFPGSSAFIGVRDFHQKVIVQHISDDSMRLVLFLTLDPRAIVSEEPLIALSTNAVVLTFTAVN